MSVPAKAARFTSQQIEEWKHDGGVLLERFFTPEEIAPCHADMDLLYGDRRDPTARATTLKKPGEIGGFSSDQFRNFDDMPFDSKFLYTGRPWFLPALVRWHRLVDKLGF